jgi:hypothetical protein
MHDSRGHRGGSTNCLFNKAFWLLRGGCQRAVQRDVIGPDRLSGRITHRDFTERKPMKKLIAVLLAATFAGVSVQAMAQAKDAKKPTAEECKKNPKLAGCEPAKK